MATELGKAYVQIMPSAKGISGEIQKTLDPESKSAGKSAGGKLGTALKVGVAGAAAGLGVTIGKSISEGGALEQSIGGVETLFKENANTVRKYADEAYKTVGVSANDYMENVTSFSASLLQSMGGDTEEAAKVAHTAMLDMGDNANKMGTDMQDIQNAYGGFAKENYTMLDNLKLGYGGTKGEMERLLADAQELTGVEYDISNLDDVFMAVHAIQEEIGITGTTALEAEETIQGSFSAMGSAFSNVLGNLALGENIGPSLSALAETISIFLFDNLFPMIGTIVSELPGAIMTFIQAAAPAFMENGLAMISTLQEGVTTGIPLFLENVQSFLGDVIVWIRQEFPNIVQAGVELISNFATGAVSNIPTMMDSMTDILAQIFTVVMDAFPTIMQGGFDLITNMGQGIMDNLPAIVDSIGYLLDYLLDTIMAEMPALLDKGLELIGNMAQGMLDSLPAIMTSITKLLGKLLDAIIEYLPQLLQKGVEIVIELAQGIVSSIPQIITTIGNLIGQLLGAIGQRIPEFLSMGFDLIIKLGDGLINAIPGIVSNIPQIISALVKTIVGLIPQFVSVGADIVKGLWKGINSVKDWILGKISGFVDSIMGGIKSFFGISSPSKVMADEVGKWLPIGLADGIEDNIKPVSDAMNRLGELTTGTLESQIRVSSIGSMDFQGSRNKNNGITQHITINSPTELSPSETARQVKNASRNLAMGW